MYKTKFKQIIKIQAAWRGYTVRQQVAVIRQTKRADSRYFTIEEQKETVRNVKFNPNARKERRPIYTFKSGATYIGEWVGGFRHGQGKQVWIDGASYEGQWKDNRAFG